MPRDFDNHKYGVKGSIPKDKRFKSKKNIGPGPGAYTNQELNPWNKKTYNLLFNV